MWPPHMRACCPESRAASSVKTYFTSPPLAPGTRTGEALPSSAAPSSSTDLQFVLKVAADAAALALIEMLPCPYEPLYMPA